MGAAYSPRSPNRNVSTSSKVKPMASSFSKSKNVWTSSGKPHGATVPPLISGSRCGDNGGCGEGEDSDADADADDADAAAAELLLLLSASTIAAAETCSIISLNLGDCSSKSSADGVGAA